MNMMLAIHYGNNDADGANGHDAGGYDGGAVTMVIMLA